MSRSQRDSRPPSNYPSRRYPDPRDPRDPRDLRDPRDFRDPRDIRDPRDYEDKREKMDRMYDEKPYDRLPPQAINSQSPPGYRYDIRRTQSSSFFDRFSRSSKKYNIDQIEREQAYRSPDSQGSKRERSPAESLSELDKISSIIKKEYQVNPPIQLCRAPMLLNPKPWD